jgi:Lamin Tail Domain
MYTDHGRWLCLPCLSRYLQRISHVLFFANIYILVGFVASADAQLQISEVLYDSVNDANWEWIEVRNLSASPVDLNNYVLDDIAGTAILDSNIRNIAAGGQATNTVVPAQGVAVLYNGSNLAFNDARFRSAWQLAANVPVIGVSSFPALNNSGDAVALWPSYASYGSDIADLDMDGDFEVAQFTNSAVNLDFQSGFPSGTDRSIYWRGTGSPVDPANWLASTAGTDGAVTSIPTFLGNTQINNTLDAGNPGVLAGTPPASGLRVTEIMFNPRSTESNWEWVEVYNGTGNTIDFGATPYVLDDASGGAIASANITAGSIPNGTTAILFNSLITSQNFKDAWGNSLNAISVSNWPALNNTGGDTVALWSNFAGYQADRTGLVYSNAVVATPYSDDDLLGWPIDDGNGSIHLSPANADPSLPGSWQLSASGDGISSNASPAFQNNVPDHPGGDVGSPGFFPGGTTMDGDFNNDGLYNCADIDPLVNNIANGTNTGSFDLTGDGQVNAADLAAWLAEAGAANIGPGRPYRVGDANLDGIVDGSDFGLWNSNKFTGNKNWCQGNFNADSVTDGSDFGLWNSNKFTASDGAVVPEPSAALLSLAIGMACVRFRHKP